MVVMKYGGEVMARMLKLIVGVTLILSSTAVRVLAEQPLKSLEKRKDCRSVVGSLTGPLSRERERTLLAGDKAIASSYIHDVISLRNVPAFTQGISGLARLSDLLVAGRRLEAEGYRSFDHVELPRFFASLLVLSGSKSRDISTRRERVNYLQV